MRRLAQPFLFLVLVLATLEVHAADDRLDAALEAAGANRGEIEAAIEGVPPSQRDAMRWLVARMPERDLKTLDAGFLVENCRLAHDAWESAPWRDAVPREVFLDAVLPYATINERRDDWRADFRERFGGFVEQASTPGEAAVLLNQKVFPSVGVRYSTQRPKADQSGLESIEAGMASCTGLSVLLIEACRAVGVPARFVGVPLWSDGSGNHSWVEVWDDGGWRFTGAAEPTGNDLDRGWFTGRASGAVRDDPRRAVWATTWNDSPSSFPMVWAPGDRSVRAVNVSDRYTTKSTPVPAGSGRLYVRLAADDGRRIAADAVLLVDGEAVGTGRTRDDGFDANDHLEFVLPLGTDFMVRLELDDGVIEAGQRFGRDEQMLEITTTDDETGGGDDEVGEAQNAGRRALLALRRDASRTNLGELAGKEYASTPLTEEQARMAARRLTAAHEQRVRRERREEFDGRVLRIGDREMPFWFKVYGDPPKGEGRALYISMHGGGGAPKRVNDQQWENQKRLYRPDEGVYLAPRAPTDTWNLWHQAHIDDFYDRLIADLVVFEGVDPDKVYFMGYSAGGDGVYQLAPRMADRLAAAAMMAGHPNETRPDGLRNLPFTLHMGGEDAAYNRNGIARNWKKALAELAAADEGGYPHEVVIHEGKGHWMEREDAVAVPWMARHRRNLRPERIVWVQDDVTHPRFYWLAVDEPKARERIVVERDGNVVTILEGAERGLRIRVDDEMFDLSRPITVKRGEDVVLEASVPRTIGTMATTLGERGDPSGVFTGEIVVPAVDPESGS